jgi:hypothetical protein
MLMKRAVFKKAFSLKNNSKIKLKKRKKTKTDICENKIFTASI